MTGDIIHCIESPTAALHWAAVYLHMTMGQKMSVKLYFLREQITMTIINRREGGENTLRSSARQGQLKIWMEQFIQSCCMKLKLETPGVPVGFIFLTFYSLIIFVIRGETLFESTRSW